MSAQIKPSLSELTLNPNNVRPILAWPSGCCGASVSVFLPTNVPSTNDLPVLAEVLGPYGQALSKGIDLNSVIADSPEIGEAMLSECIEASLSDISVAKSNGAHGILYAVCGATEEHCSPMQYGGLYLERDREVLLEATKWAFVFLFVVGSENTYMDIVSDLPCDVMGWSIEATGHSLSEMKIMSKGATCTSDPNSEWAWNPKMSETEAIAKIERDIKHV